MRRIWGSSRERGLEQRLRDERPQPSRAFLSELTGELDAPKRRSPAPRVVFAGLLSAALLVALAAVGGVGYAASSAAQVVRVVSKALSPSSKSGKVSVSGLSAGNDQYRPGYGWGDPRHNHTGPPGLKRKGTPPHAKRKGKAYVVTTRVNVDEQADLRISVLNARGKALGLSQGKGKALKTIRFRVLVPRTLTLSLTLPQGVLVKGATYRIKIVATDPQRHSRTLFIAFKG